MHLLRAIKTTHNLLLWSIWEQAGEVMRFDLNLPGEWTCYLASGGIEVIYPVDLDPPPWVLALPEWDARARRFVTEWPAVIRMRADLRNVLIRSTQPDTRVACLAPLDRAYLLGMLRSAALVDAILSDAGFDGPVHQVLTVWEEGVQVDPRTLTKIERGASVVDVDVVESVALNDLRRVLSGKVAPVGAVTVGREA